ncbi:MAG: hypothetical protein AAF357_19750 [Verrucomicrobiota bacterium]
MGGGTKRGSPESEGSSDSLEKKVKREPDEDGGQGGDRKRRRLIAWEPVRE